MAKPSWVSLFGRFASDIRIKSKEVLTDDPRGAPLEMWDSQRRVLREIGNGLDAGIHKFNILKSRQLGVTTLTLAIDVFWLAMHRNVIGCIVADTEKNRDANRRLIEHFVGSFPEGYFGGEFAIENANRSVITFTNGCRLDLLVAGTKRKSTAWGEGVGYVFCHATEVASYADPEGLKSLEEGFAQQNPNRLFIFESTAKGMNHWRERYMEGLEDTLSQRSMFTGWWSGDTNLIPRSDPRFLRFGNYKMTNDERQLVKQVLQQYDHKITDEQLAWIRWKEASAGNEQDLLAQNQPWTAEQAFVMTGFSFFQVRVINKDLQKMETDKQEYWFKAYRYEVDGDFFHFTMVREQKNLERVELKIWEEPEPGGRYVIGFDPAYGRNDHKDGHAIVVARCYADRLVQVAEYLTADVETKHASWVLFHLMAAYGDCMANVELGGPGRLVMSEIEHLRQLLSAEMNQARTKAKNWEDAGAQARWFLYHKVDSPGAGYVANFETTWRTKMELMHSMRGAYSSGEFHIRSKRLLLEMRNVVVVDDKIGAPESSNADMKDDRVFAWALANRAWQEWTRKEMIAQGLTYEVVSRQETNQENPTLTRSINSQVYRFLLGANAEPEPERGPKWLVDRGLA